MSEEQERFGDVIHEARLCMRPALSLRKLAGRLGIAPAYLSKIENNLDRPPSAKVVEKMAENLNLDKIALLKKANRVPSDWDDTFKEDNRAPDFLRVAKESGLSPLELEKLIKDNQAKKSKRR
ncbi:helix-turn-helix transcriptional regulator [bacterium]|nr:helix-turn-helix transcriptional regulator [bacterium]